MLLCFVAYSIYKLLVFKKINEIDIVFLTIDARYPRKNNKLEE